MKQFHKSSEHSHTGRSALGQINQASQVERSQLNPSSAYDLNEEHGHDIENMSSETQLLSNEMKEKYPSGSLIAIEQNQSAPSARGEKFV